MADALLHDFDWNTDDHAAHVDTVLQQMARLGERAGQKIDTAYWNTALLDETCPTDDMEYDIVWMAWLARRARLTPDCERDAPHVAVLARRLETFNGKKKQRPIYLSQALAYVTCAGYMDQSFGDAPPSPTRRAVRDNCLVLATHADACDMPIVREVWMHLFARTARATPSEVLKALLAWVLREESEAGGLRAIRVLISLEETWKVLPLSDVRGMRVLYQKLLDRASDWESSGNAKVLWLGHLHRVQARSSLVQQRAALHLEQVVEHVMQSISGGENLYIVQVSYAVYRVALKPGLFLFVLGVFLEQDCNASDCGVCSTCLFLCVLCVFRSKTATQYQNPKVTDIKSMHRTHVLMPCLDRRLLWRFCTRHACGGSRMPGSRSCCTRLHTRRRWKRPWPSSWTKATATRRHSRPACGTFGISRT